MATKRRRTTKSATHFSYPWQEYIDNVIALRFDVVVESAPIEQVLHLHAMPFASERKFTRCTFFCQSLCHVGEKVSLIGDSGSLFQVAGQASFQWQQPA